MQLQNFRNKTTFDMYFNYSAVKLCTSQLSNTMRNILITEQFCLNSILFSIKERKHAIRAAYTDDQSD